VVPLAAPARTPALPPEKLPHGPASPRRLPDRRFLRVRKLLSRALPVSAVRSRPGHRPAGPLPERVADALRRSGAAAHPPLAQPARVDGRSVRSSAIHDVVAHVLCSRQRCHRNQRPRGVSVRPPLNLRRRGRKHPPGTPPTTVVTILVTRSAGPLRVRSRAAAAFLETVAASPERGSGRGNDLIAAENGALDLPGWRRLGRRLRFPFRNRHRRS